MLTIISNAANSYSITINGKPFQVNIVSQNGDQISDVDGYLLNDYGHELPKQKNVICSSLKDDYCSILTNEPKIKFVPFTLPKRARYTQNKNNNNNIQINYDSNYDSIYVKKK